jgi:hypothetical protein
MGQTTNRNRARLPSLFGMKFTQLPSQYSSQPGPTCRRNNVAQEFSCLTLGNGTERWRKVVLHNLWRSHMIGIDWHPFGVFEADDYCQNCHWQFGKTIDIYKLYIHEEK